MASPLVNIVPIQVLPVTATLLYTSGTGTWTQVVKLSCINIDTAAHTVTIYMVPSGSAGGNATITTSAQVVSPGQTWNSPNEYGHVLNPGDAIYAFASVAGFVNIIASGLQAT